MKHSDLVKYTNPLSAALIPVISSCAVTVLNKRPQKLLDSRDVSIQTLMLLFQYSATELFLGNRLFIQEMSSNVESMCNKSTLQIINDAIRLREIKVNVDLVKSSLYQALDASLKRYNSQEEELLKELQYTYFKASSNAPAEITKRNAQYQKYDDFFSQMLISEKNSKKTVFFRPIDKELKKRYWENLHYLHSDREDDIISFGAFTQDYKYPFAAVSFSKHKKEYKNNVFETLGIEPRNLIEMTRAWSTDWAPKNTMSSLFEYSMKQIAQASISYGYGINGIKRKKDIAVNTTINSNLGFLGTSFWGCNFYIVALKMAKFTYFKDSYDNFNLMGRDEIRNAVEEKYLYNYKESPNYKESVFPLLPQYELIRVFSPEKENYIREKEVAIINRDCYISPLNIPKIK